MSDAYQATLDPRQAPPGDALSARPPSADALSLDPIIQRIQQNQGAMQANQQAKEAAIEPQRQQMIGMLRQPQPQAPTPQQAPPVPQARNEPGADEQWLMVASVLGAIAGGLTRRHVTNALGAMTGALEGYQQGSKARFDQQMTQWEAENKKIQETNKAANERYRQILESNKLSLEQKAMEIQLTAAKYEDRAAMMLAQNKDLEGLGRLEEARITHGEKAQEFAVRMAEAHAKWQDQFALKKQELQIKAEVAAAKRGQLGDKLISDKAIDFMADQYLAGDTSVFTNLGRGAQGAENIGRLRSAIAQKAEERGIGGGRQAVTQAEYKGLQSAERALGTREANIGTAIIEANKFASNALAASDKLGRSNFVPWNQLKQTGQRALSNPDLAQFRAYNNSFLQMYTRAVQGSGTVTVDARRHADEMLSTADGPQAYRAVIQALQAEMRAAVQAPQELRELIRTNELSHLGAEVSRDGAVAPPSPPSSGESGGVPWRIIQ